MKRDIFQKWASQVKEVELNLKKHQARKELKIKSNGR